MSSLCMAVISLMDAEGNKCFAEVHSMGKSADGAPYVTVCVEHLSTIRWEAGEVCFANRTSSAPVSFGNRYDSFGRKYVRIYANVPARHEMASITIEAQIKSVNVQLAELKKKVAALQPAMKKKTASKRKQAK